MGLDNVIVRRSAGIAGAILMTSAVLTSAVLTSASLLPAASAQSANPPESPPELAEFYKQTLDWQPCQLDSCTRVKVPLDYSNPTGNTISLAVRVIGSRELPSLMVNPGGPGSGGINFARDIASAFSPKIRRAFSIVGFDPRGTGESWPITCLTGKQASRWLRTDSTPDTPREIKTFMSRAAKVGRGCEDFSRELAAHVGTSDTVRDLDVLREVLGNSTLNWLGFSYGTSIGARYAELFPNKIGRMVLDGAVNPALNSMELSKDQAKGFQTAMRRYETQFPGSIKRINSLLEKLDERPLPTSRHQPLIQSEALTAILYSMYSPTLWPELDGALANAYRGNGSRLQEIAYSANDQIGPEKFASNFLSAFYAINCLDYPTTPNADGLARRARTWSRDVPVPEISRTLSWGNAPCTTWFDHVDRLPQPARSTTESPIVVIGTRFDPATPLSWARALNGQLPTSDLLIYIADGHTAYLNGNACIDQYVDTYLVTGQTSGDKTCRD